MQHGAGVQANFFLFWHDFPLIPTLSEGLSFPCCEYLGIFSRNSLIMYVWLPSGLLCFTARVPVFLKAPAPLRFS